MVCRNCQVRNLAIPGHWQFPQLVEKQFTFLLKIYGTCSLDWKYSLEANLPIEVHQFCFYLKNERAYTNTEIIFDTALQKTQSKSLSKDLHSYFMLNKMKQTNKMCRAILLVMNFAALSYAFKADYSPCKGIIFKDIYLPAQTQSVFYFCYKISYNLMDQVL